MKALPIIAFYFFTASTGVLTANQGDITLRESRVGGSFSVKVDKFSETPDWEPGKSDIPVSIEDATALAMEVFKKHRPKYKAAMIIDIRDRLNKALLIGNVIRAASERLN